MHDPEVVYQAYLREIGIGMRKVVEPRNDPHDMANADLLEAKRAKLIQTYGTSPLLAAHNAFVQVLRISEALSDAAARGWFSSMITRAYYKQTQPPALMARVAEFEKLLEEDRKKAA